MSTDHDLQSLLEPIARLRTRTEMDDILSRATERVRARRYRRRALLTVVLIATAIASCTVPVEHTETVGYSVSGSVDLADEEGAQAVFAAARSLSIPSSLLIETRAHANGSVRTWVVVMPDATSSQAADVATTLAVAGGVGVSVEPMEAERRVPIIRAVLPEALVPWGWQSTQLLSSDLPIEEVERLINDSVRQRAHLDAVVRVVETPSGQRELRIASDDYNPRRVRELASVVGDLDARVGVEIIVGYRVHGRFLPSDADEVMSKLRSLEVSNGRYFGMTHFDDGVQWLTFDAHLPGEPREEAEAARILIAEIQGVVDAQVARLSADLNWAGRVNK